MAPSAGAARIGGSLPPIFSAHLYGQGTSVVASYRTVATVRTMAVVATAPLPAGTMALALIENDRVIAGVFVRHADAIDGGVD